MTALYDLLIYCKIIHLNLRIKEVCTYWPSKKTTETKVNC